MALIDLLKLGGFTLSEIGRFVDAEGRTAAGWRDEARAKLRELDSRLLEIEQARTILKHTVACPAESLDRCGVYRSIVATHAATLTTSAGSPAIGDGGLSASCSAVGRHGGRSAETPGSRSSAVRDNKHTVGRATSRPLAPSVAPSPEG